MFVKGMFLAGFLSTLLCLHLAVGASSSLSELPFHQAHYFTDFDAAHRELSMQCSSTDEKKGQQQATARKNIYRQKTAKMKQSQKLIFNNKFYNALSKIYGYYDTQTSQGCSIYFALLDTHKFLYLEQQQTINIFEQNNNSIGLLHNVALDFRNTSKKINESQPLLLSHTHSHHNHNHTHTPTTFQTQSIGAKSSAIQDMIQEYIENETYKTIFLMYRSNFFTYKEYQEIVNNTIISFTPQSCAINRGRFVVSDLYVNKKYDSRVFNKVELSFHGCPNIFYLTNLDQMIQKLVIHEAGGHYAHNFKDTKRKEFTDLCRDQHENKRKQCTDETFVSAYAQGDQREDYAETFTYRWMGLTAPNNPILQAKIDHMKQLGKRLHIKNH